MNSAWLIIEDETGTDDHRGYELTSMASTTCRIIDGIAVPNDGSFLQAPLERFQRAREKEKQVRNLSGFTADEVKREAERIHLNSVFDSITEFEYAIRSWSVLAQRSLTFSKSSSSIRLVTCRYGKKIRKFASRGNMENSPPGDITVQSKVGCGSKARLACSDESIERCKWRVRAMLKQDTQQYKITVCNLVHTCPAYVHTWRGAAHNARWLASTLVNRVTAQYDIRATNLVEMFRGDYKRPTNYHAMWRGKELAKDDISGGEKESFQRIPAYCDALQQADPAALVAWDVFPGTQTFWRIFVCPGAQREAFAYLRPHVGLDACFTKNRRYPMQLFLATALDGNNHIMILAWALTDKEDEGNWHWFCYHLSQAVYGINFSHVSICSDRQKGLKVAVRSIFTGQQHINCTVHMERNVRAKFNVKVEKLFMKLHRATSERKYKEILKLIEEENPTAAEYIGAIDPSTYVYYAVKCPRFGQSSSNVVESANAMLVDLRNYAPLKLLVELYKFVMQSVAKRQKEAMQGQHRLTAYALEKQTKNETLAGQFRVYDSSSTACLVSSASTAEEFVVKSLPDVHCSCLEVRDMLWPCPHVMAWDRELRRDSERLINRVWSQDFLKLAYSRSLPPFSTHELLVSHNCRPPPRAVRTGRHRVRRIPSEGMTRGREREGSSQRSAFEVVHYPVDDSDVEESKQAKKIRAPAHCSLCRGPGHNKRSCTWSGQGKAVPSGKGKAAHSNRDGTPAPVIVQDGTPAPVTLQEENIDENIIQETTFGDPWLGEDVYYANPVPQAASLSRSKNEFDAMATYAAPSENDAQSQDEDTRVEYYWHLNSQLSQASCLSKDNML